MMLGGVARLGCSMGVTVPDGIVLNKNGIWGIHMKNSAGKRILSTAGLVLGALIAGQAVATESWEAYLDQVRIKQVIADSLTPEQLAARREQLARWLEQQAQTPRTPGDTCLVATNEVSALPFNPPADTTVGQVDDFKIPADTTNPTCSAPTTCTGAGPAGSLPRGAIYTGTGVGPDRAYKIRTNVACTLNITMDPTGAEDMALVTYQTQCSNNPADCACVDDTGVGGVAESVSLTTVAGTDYFIVADGYSSGGTPPGPSGPFTISVTETTATGCALVGAASADLSITKTDGVATVNAGGNTTYTITASNAGPDAVNGATVADTFAGTLTCTWTCAGAGGGTCTANGAGNINDTVNLPSGGSVTYTASCAISGAASGSLVNTATVTGIGAVLEVNGANNTATDTDTVNTNAPPVFDYAPTPTSAVNFTGGGAVGSTGNGSIAVSIQSAGIGTGVASTTTTTCTAPGAPFAGFGQSVTAEGAGAISGGPLTGTCTLGVAPIVQTLTCSENQGGTPVSRTFELTCPAGSLAPLTSTPASGGTVTLPSQLPGGATTTALIDFQNGNAAPVDVTCTAPAAPFSASPLLFTVPANGSASVTVSFDSTTVGSFTGTLDCTASNQNFSFNLAGSALSPDVPVPAIGDAMRNLLVLLTLVIGGVAFGFRRRA